MSRRIQRATYVPNLKDLSWFIRLWLQKCVWLTFGFKVGQSDSIAMEFKLNTPYHLPNAHIKFQIEISKLNEIPENSDGRVDGHCHGIIRPFFKRAYKTVTTDETRHYVP